MKNWTPFVVIVALFLSAWGVYTFQAKKNERERMGAVKQVKELKEYNRYLEKKIDSLGDIAVVKDVEMMELEMKADSLAELATLPMPCEHELELRMEEIEAVRGALVKCKESKAIQTTRVGLSEIRVENQVQITDHVVTIQKKDLKKEKRKAFFKGAGAGGLLVAILIILAL